MIISLFLVASISLFKTWPNYLRLFSLNLYSIVHSYHSVNNFTFSSIFPKCRVTLHKCRETLHKWRRKNETTGGKGCRGLDLVFAVWTDSKVARAELLCQSRSIRCWIWLLQCRKVKRYRGCRDWRRRGGGGVEEAQPPSPKRETLLLRRKEGFRERGHLNCMLHIS